MKLIILCPNGKVRKVSDGDPPAALIASHFLKKMDLAGQLALWRVSIGCGAGRVALHLQSRSHDVLGVDTECFLFSGSTEKKVPARM